ncbi:hypothetical protein LDENG_00217700 [Lucifuga dentata]|nr:hypothetical protein LDENG_00217700 [Lucifuga dentata]
MLFIDYSSAFTIIPSKLVSKLVDLGLGDLHLQLDIRLPDGQAPGGENWQPHFLLADPQHRHTSGLCAQPPALKHHR